MKQCLSWVQGAQRNNLRDKYTIWITIRVLARKHEKLLCNMLSRIEKMRTFFHHFYEGFEIQWFLCCFCAIVYITFLFTTLIL